MAFGWRRSVNPVAEDAEMLATLEAKLDRDLDAIITGSKRPSRKDFELIGTFIQVYSFAEFSARQIIELIDIYGPPGKLDRATRLAAHDVFPKLAEAADRLTQMGDGNLKETLVRAAATIDMHRIMRHTLAHWAVRRVERGRAYLLLSKNAQEGKKRHGRMISAGESHYGFVGVASMRAELRKLEQHTQNLSVIVLAMREDPESLRKMLAT